MKNKDIIYLDYNATTPTDPRVVEEMLPYFYEKPGNASSRNHPYGWQAEEAVKKSRSQIADLIHVDPKEIIFTSGATESINLAIKGVFDMYHRSGNHIITAATEHKAVLDTCESIEKRGGEVSYLNVGSNGSINLKELESTITKNTILVSILWANNETGTIENIKEIGKICEQKGVLLMSDATQMVGKLKISPKKMGVHIMAFSSHKMYGPKGVGALYVSNNNPRVKLTEQISGGGHERKMRSGTLNVPGIVGMGSAAALCNTLMEEESQRLILLRDRLENSLLGLEETVVNGDIKNRLPHVSNITFKYVDAEALLSMLNLKIALATGSACTSASIEPSHVLMAMGKGENMAHSSIRFSLGRYTTQDEVEEVITMIKEGVKKLRASNPEWKNSYRTKNVDE